MNGGHLQLALRELRDTFSHLVTLAALAGVAVVVGVSGPFGTLEAFTLLPRLAYWALVVPLTYGAGLLGTLAVHPYLPRGSKMLRIALAALGSAIAVSLVLGGLHIGLGLNLGGARSIAVGFSAVYIICLVIEAVGEVLKSQSKSQSKSQDRTSAQQSPALLSRLPLNKRGALLALTAGDHYITVITEKGREMVLMRLGDAIHEAAPVAGLQIHRSHWVALGAVAKVARVGDTAEVTLTNGETLPVARARMGNARAAGLLPRKGV